MVISFNRLPFTFARRYKLFSLALLATIAGGVLELFRLHTPAHSILAVISLIIALPLIKDMYDDYNAGAYGIDVLALTAIITSVILRQYWAAIVIVLMLTGGKALEDFAEHRSKTELTALLKHAPQVAHILRGKKIVDAAASAVRTNDKILIKPGEVVPVDSIVLNGSGSFDESSLTGESIPEAKEAGSALLSGSINIDGAITAKATATAAASQYQQIVRLVQSAAASKAPFVRMADRYSIPFTLFAFALAGTVWFLSGQAIRFLEVIVVATPCPLLLAAPIAIVSGMGRATRHGIIVRTGSALERLAQIRTIALDKTGTLTQGKPAVAEITTFGMHTKVEVLSLAAALATSSRHILCSAISEEALEQGLKVPKSRHIRESAGHGMTGTVGGKKIVMGRLRHLEKYDIDIRDEAKAIAKRQTIINVAIDGELAGCITFSDEIRPETKVTLDRLKVMGVRHFLMITGDTKTAAAKVAKRLGITDVQAEALPATKLKAIEAVPYKPVAFVGDGVNDAPVLTAADVGIAMGARGSTAASESADIVIMRDDFSLIVDILGIARRTFRIARQSVLAGIGLSVALMIVFATGKFQPVVGAAAQEVVDIIVILNALRAHSSGK